ncbi:unnamed protein product [Caenorhabditis sp. 36 PRJEB53466]|nr:unnamed protein product [Caenorhabditis sp. 36 PRJEB53466]
MDYFNAGGAGSGVGGATSGGAPVPGAIADPYAVIPQQFGNGGMPQQQQQQPVFEYQQEADYETYQQQQQYRAAQQQQQQSPSIYYQNPMGAVAGSYFPIHSASEHDFLGPQLTPSGASPGGTGQGAPYQTQQVAPGAANKDFMMHHQRRNNQSGQQQQQQGQSSSSSQHSQHRNPPPPPQQQQQQTHFMHHQLAQQVQQQAVQQQMHRGMHGNPINPQQFMVPPPNIQQIQAAQQQHAQQQQQHHHHQQMQQIQMHHPALLQQAAQGAQQFQAAQQVQQHHQNQHGNGGGGGVAAHQQQQQHQNQNTSHHHHPQQHGQHHQNSQQNQQQQQPPNIQNQQTIHQNQNPHHQQQQPHHLSQLAGPPIGPPMGMPRMPIRMLKDWPIRCVIEGKYQPVIIGPHGSVLKEIAHSTKCHVIFMQLSQRERSVLGHNDRILTVHGNAEHASKAVARILDVIQQEALKEDENVGADIVLRLRAHNQLCGRLIGKQGATIKEIMQKTGTSITVAKFVDPPNEMGVRQEEMLCLMERTIVVRGPSIEAVVQAEALISNKLKKCYEVDSQLRQMQAAALSPVPLGLPALPLMPGGPPSLNPTIVHPPSLIPTPTGLIQVQHFPPAINAPLTASNSFLQPGALQIQPGVSTLREVRMWAPDSMIGALIGPKGNNIRMIIRETGAQVKIESPEEKAAREAEEEHKKRENEQKEETEAGEGAGDPGEFVETETVTSADAIEEKPKPVPERLVTVTGDDLQLLKAQSFVFSKIAETSPSSPTQSSLLSAPSPSAPPPPQAPPATVAEFGRLLASRIRTEVSVPTRIIGRIIGRGGQNVRELQRITGAVVKIPEHEQREETFRHDDGFEEEVTMIRVVGNMHATHNVQFRLAHLVAEYYRTGEHRERRAGRGTSRRAQNAHPAANRRGSPLENVGSLGHVAPIASTSRRASPQSSESPQKSKSP